MLIGLSAAVLLGVLSFFLTTEPELLHWLGLNFEKNGKLVAAYQVILDGVQLVIVASAAYYALKQVRAIESTNRVSQCFVAMCAEVSDQDLLLMRDRWRQIRKEFEMRDEPVTYDAVVKLDAQLNPAGAGPLANTFHEPRKRLQDFIIQLCNHYEARAIGVRRGAIDKQMYGEWWQESYVLDWIDLRAFVNDYREKEGSKKAFIEFDRLALEWVREEHLSALSKDDRANILRLSRKVKALVAARGAEYRGDPYVRRRAQVAAHPPVRVAA